MLKRRDEFSLKDLQKAVELLEILATGGERSSVSALARRAGISRYKATRLLTTLEKKGLVELALQSGKCDPVRARSLAEKLVATIRGMEFPGAILDTILPQQTDE